MAGLKGTIGGAAELGGSLAPVGGYSASMRGAIGPISDSIRDGAVTTPKLADLAVTTAKIADAAVTLAKLASEVIDATLSITGAAADAKATGDALALKAAAADLTALANSLGDAAYYDVANNLTTATAGEKVLDAAQGKALNDKIPTAPFSTTGYLASTSDADTVAAGVYYCNDAVQNIPVSTAGFLMSIKRSDAGGKAQLFIPAAAGYVFSIFKRQYVVSTSTWTAWARLNGTDASLSPVGTIISDTLTTATSCGNSAFLNAATIAHEAGTYVVVGYVSFATNTSGARSMLITSSATGSSAIVTSARARVAPVTGFETTFGCSGIIKATAAGTWYLRAWQNSGAALNVTGAQLTAIKIAD